MWFRRRSFSADYADVTPKWHLQASVDGRVRIAACEYKYEFFYDTPMTQETAPERQKCCIKCLRAAPSDGPAARIVRFPTLEEQSKGMLTVPRHKRLAPKDDSIS